MPPPRCDCGSFPHRSTCPVDLERRARELRRLDRIAEANEERAAGLRLFSDATRALGWYHRTRAAWSAPRARPLGFETGGGRVPGEDSRRRAFAAIAFAIRAVEEDERACHPERPAPIGDWIAAHHGAGRSYWAIHEADPSWSLDQIKRRMARSHALVARRLAEGGWLRDD